MRAAEVMNQNDGEVTKKYYAKLSDFGPFGLVAVALFRASKRSARAKDYRRGKFRRAAYDVKTWSMGELCRLLEVHDRALGIEWGWKQDHKTVLSGDSSWVLYVVLPDIGQASFHSPTRMEGPDFAGEWDGQRRSSERIMYFCDCVFGYPQNPRPANLVDAPMVEQAGLELS